MLITISRQTGSLGQEITDLLGQNMDLPVINRDLAMRNVFPEVASQHEIHMLAESPSFFLTTASDGLTFAQHLENRLRARVAAESLIIFGLGAQIIFANHPGALHVKIIASPEVRISRIMQSQGLGKKDAERFLELSDRKHKRYISALYGKDWSDPLLYHITLNTDYLNINEAAALIQFMAENQQVPTPEAETAAEEQKLKPVVFKHQSEEEFAKILDMHGMEWEYEPRTFPIKWDAEGNVIQAFSPDFYLPRFDTYIELTTMDQRYVAQKKKKVQLLRKLYPGTNINIVFKKDFNTLIKRFGLLKGAQPNE